jgi:integrase
VTLEGKKPCLHVRVQAVTVRERGKYHQALEAPKTERSRRRVELGPDIVQELNAHKARQELEKQIAGDTWQALSLVFPNPRGGIAYGTGLWALFRRLAARAGLPPEVVFHTLRHTAITLALEAGQPLKAVAEMVGDTEATILRVYAHVTPHMRESLAATMSSLLTSPDASLQYNLQSEEVDRSRQA